MAATRAAALALAEPAAPVLLPAALQADTVLTEAEAKAEAEAARTRRASVAEKRAEAKQAAADAWAKLTRKVRSPDTVKPEAPKPRAEAAAQTQPNPIDKPLREGHGVGAIWPQNGQNEPCGKRYGQ